MSKVTVRLIRDIYLYVDGVRHVFHEKGETMEGELLDKPDWLVGCQVVKLAAPMKNGDEHLGVGYDCEILPPTVKASEP